MEVAEMPAQKQASKVYLQGCGSGCGPSSFCSPVYAAVNEHLESIENLQYKCVNKLGTNL